MNGQRALIYSRIRENRLDPAETDLDRARRQQQVIQATADKVTSFGTALKLPFKRRQHRQAARDRPHRRPGDASSAGRTSGPTRATRCTVGSAASPAAPTVSRSSSAPRTTSPRSRCSPGAPLRWRRRRVFPTRRAAPSETAGCEPRSVRGGGLLVARAGVLGGLLLLARVALLARAAAVAVLRRALARSRARSRSSRSRSPCNAPRPGTAPSRPGSRRTSRSSRPVRRSSSGRARTGVPVRATVLVDRHQGANLPAKMRPRSPMTQTAEASPSSRPLVATARAFLRRPRALDRRRRDRSRRDGVPAPPADGLAAARGRDPGALRRARQPRRASSSTSPAIAAVRRCTFSSPTRSLTSHLGLGSLRLVSAAFAVGSLPLVALLGRRLADRWTALIATALVAGSWVFLFHGVYARMYSLFLFLSLLSFVLLLRALDRGTLALWSAVGDRDPARRRVAPLRRARAGRAGRCSCSPRVATGSGRR